MTDLLEEDSGPSCPCCGGHTYSDIDCEYGEPCGWSVTCMKCQLTIYKKTKELALAAWTRTPTTDTSEKAMGGDVPKSSMAALELMNYGQADMDGIIVTVSRQAIHEVIDELSALKSTSNARIAELEAALDIILGSDVVANMNYQSKIDSLLEQLSTARNDALEKALRVVAFIGEDHSAPLVRTFAEAFSAACNHIENEIRNLKTDTQGEG